MILIVKTWKRVLLEKPFVHHVMRTVLDALLIYANTAVTFKLLKLVLFLFFQFAVYLSSRLTSTQSFPVSILCAGPKQFYRIRWI